MSDGPTGAHRADKCSFDEIPYLVCHLSLETPTGDDASAVTVLDPRGQTEVVSMLYGTLVAAPVEMDNMEGARGVYSVFPDLSVRLIGRFRIRAALYRITG